MFNQDWIGLAAGSLTTISFVPQVVQIWRTKHADDISTSMFVIFMIGVALWLLYGIYLHALPVIIANSVTLLLAATVLILKFHFHKARQ
ncbi:MAG: SemiSWEET transporter [Sulfuriferula sp.]|jgi:MtN3 and saliva related transmembrane protein|nr:SemiSWEET transporter [Sulfuriferula sp.]